MIGSDIWQKYREKYFKIDVFQLPLWATVFLSHWWKSYKRQAQLFSGQVLFIMHVFAILK